MVVAYAFEFTATEGLVGALLVRSGRACQGGVPSGFRNV